MGPDLGDYSYGQTVRFMFATYGAFGESRDLDNDGTIDVVRDDGNHTTSPNVVTLTRNFDGVTGLHLVEIDTDAAGQLVLARGHGFNVIKRGGTLDGVAHHVHLASFSIEHRRDEHVAGYAVQLSATFVLIESGAPQVADLHNGQLLVVADTSNSGQAREILNYEPIGGGAALVTLAEAFPTDDGSFAYVISDAPNPDA